MLQCSYNGAGWDDPKIILNISKHFLVSSRNNKTAQSVTKNDDLINHGFRMVLYLWENRWLIVWINHQLLSLLNPEQIIFYDYSA